MKILHLAAAEIMLNPILRDQLIFLRNNGFDVHTASMDGFLARTFHEKYKFPWTPLPVTRSISPWGDIRCMQFIEQLCRNNKYFLVHTHTPKGNFVGTAGAKKAETPLVFETIHGFYFHDETPVPLKKIWVGIEQRNAKNCQRVLFQNPEDIETSVAEGICSRDKSVLIGNGINLKTFDPGQYSQSEKIELRQKWEIPPDAIVVGMVGRFVKEKGWPILWEASVRLAQKFPRIHFLGVGHRLSGERQTQSWKPPVKKSELKHWTILENQEETAALYACMDLFAFPSHREGFPRVLMEASAGGLPQIGFNIRGCRQIIGHQKTGLLIPPYSKEQFELGIEQLVSDENLRKTWGIQARKKAEVLYDQNALFQRILGCYREEIQKAETRKVLT